MIADIEPLRILSFELARLAASFVALLPNLIAALIVLVLTWALARYAWRGEARLLRRWHRRPALIAAARTLTRSLIWFSGLIVSATLIFPGMSATNVVAGLGVGSLVVGLAFRDIFENYLAGVLILLRKPMRIGDDILCQGIEGQVEQITIRDTYLRRRSGELVLVPNSFIYSNPTTVLTDRPLRRITLEVGVAYGTELEHARAVFYEALSGLDTVDAAEKIEVFCQGFGDSSIDFVLRWWAGSTPVEELRSRDEVARSVKRALDDAGIEIPFPQRTLSFLEPVPPEGIKPS
ncbi:mechanosensitive ion channel [Paracoccus liaowanqingii]|uniref:Small-conductance mechanosensitive channel n=1 Tax=Paracoccus liaowanqingii TaxID=2560053 RepID=A0A4Z1CFS1_9RHOB|nr:mechanosensitive ion channel [Paracoccus liaowanqingii]QDA36876.1 mechanosensitive ion channel [Paracoccus liaowanqingii]TGN58388.1 mechanosensitive ion channel [Paracoccus liaowanqingii]